MSREHSLGNATVALGQLSMNGLLSSKQSRACRRDRGSDTAAGGYYLSSNYHSGAQARHQHHLKSLSGPRRWPQSSCL